MNKEYVLVRHSFSDDLGKAMVDRGYSCCLMYKNNKSFIHRTLRRLCHKLHLPFEQFWFDKSILNYDGKIVVFEPLCTPTYMKWLRKNKPDADIVFWYWNIAKNTVSPDTIKPEWCRKWSFARLDCKKYGMEFNPLPYFNELVLEPQEKKYDIIFVGKDKGRLPALLEFKQTFDKMNLKTKFIISPTNRYTKHPEYSPSIKYMESVQLGMQSKAILDYIEINNSGQSIRVIESLFQKEKIITNSILISDYDFYCPENIFILGQDKLEDLPSFLNTPYKEIDPAIVKQYDFDCVIKRFFESDGYSEKMMEHIGDIS
ncbi:MAG: hypothetical protein IKW45_09885 [Clostridia bacterium]|nr:hypothetical protein [Clostridia bacterium]